MLDKAIQHKKEKRKPYHSAKAINVSCRNHGGCPYCEKNRLYSTTKAKEKADTKLKEDF